MMVTDSLKQDYKERIVPALMKQFGYSSVMECPRLEKIVLNQGHSSNVTEKKNINSAIEEMTLITDQKDKHPHFRKDIYN